MHIQKGFNPVNYCFKWTEDWYDWDSATGKKEAMKARNDYARELKKQGYTVKKWTLKDQLVRRGGIGSGHPDVEFWTNSYYVDAFKED